MLHHRCSGTGEPLVLIHGLFGSLENLGAVARLLAREYRVYSVDLPNHGRSSHQQGADLEVMAERLNLWMAEEGLERAHVVGHSLGGKVAMELALRNPERVERLIVIDIAPVAYPPRHNDVFAGLLALEPNTLRQRSEADAILADYVSEAAVRTFLLKNLVKADDGFSWRMNLADIHQSYPRLIMANGAGRFDRPVLFLKGEKSDYLAPAHKAETTQRFPEAQLREVENTAHWLHAEKPELVSKLIIKFLSSESVRRG